MDLFPGDQAPGELGRFPAKVTGFFGLVGLACGAFFTHMVFSRIWSNTASPLGAGLERPEEQTLPATDPFPEFAHSTLFLGIIGAGQHATFVFHHHHPSIDQLGHKIGEEASGGQRQPETARVQGNIADPGFHRWAPADGHGAVKLLAATLEVLDHRIQVLGKLVAAAVERLGLAVRRLLRIKRKTVVPADFHILQGSAEQKLLASGAAGTMQFFQPGFERDQQAVLED